MNRLFRRKNKALKAEVPPAKPRPLAVIEAEYNQLRGLVADSQYQVYVHTKVLAEYNEKMLALNQEGAVRKELDAKAKVEAAPQPEAQSQETK